MASRAVRLRGAVLVNGVLSTLSGAARWAAAQERRWNSLEVEAQIQSHPYTSKP